ncbi:MAG: phytanoyl-CoA dioxygenase family protein [Candidatus Eremiobacteraeota bacterium]|nr:phytanoyl-CoA dioxygenase family protein [Candidatus Eremiobacteraeota bacterium]
MVKPLSTAQIDHFADVGFLRVKHVVPKHLVDTAKERLVADLESPTGPHYKNGDGAAYKLYGLLERGGPYESIITYPPLLDVMEALVGGDIVYTRNRHNHGSLMPAGESVFRPHRDILRSGYVSVIVYLDNVTADNGPTLVIPSSHRWPFAADREDGIFLDLMTHPGYADLCDQMVPVLAAPGDIVAFDGLLFHAAARNAAAAGTRASLALGYRAVDELTGVSEHAEYLVRGRDLYRGNIVVPRAW